MATKPKGDPRPVRRASLTAHATLERLGIEPMEMLKEVYDLAIEAYKSGRGYSDKSDSGTGYLSVAGKAASDLARFKHPMLSAIAVKDLSNEKEDKKPMTTQEAIEVIKNDPFSPKSIQASDVIDAMKSKIQTPMLPGGNNET